jgi:Spy/CpxP family protein refolding chaperone
MRAIYSALVGLGLVGILAGTAAAQGQGRGGFGRFGGGGGYAMLLGNESVQKELKLEDQQIEKAKELGDKIREKMTAARSELQGLDQEEQRTKMTALMREVNESTMKSAAEFLKPEQITRLKQISLQTRGAMAFSDPEVAKKLNITDSQKSDIQSIVEASRSEMPSREDFQSDREAAMKKMAEINKDTVAKVAAKLNDEQQKSWKEMIGAPFEIKYQAPRNN